MSRFPDASSYFCKSLGLRGFEFQLYIGVLFVFMYYRQNLLCQHVLSCFCFISAGEVCLNIQTQVLFRSRHILCWEEAIDIIISFYKTSKFTRYMFVKYYLFSISDLVCHIAVHVTFSAMKSYVWYITCSFYIVKTNISSNTLTFYMKVIFFQLDF